MGDCDLEVDPERLTDMAGVTLEVVRGMSRDAQRFVDTSIVPFGAFGESEAAHELRAVTVRLTQAAEALLADFQGVAEHDVDNLYRAAFAYRETDGCHGNVFERTWHRLGDVF